MARPAWIGAFCGMFFSPFAAYAQEAAAAPPSKGPGDSVQSPGDSPQNPSDSAPAEPKSEPTAEQPPSTSPPLSNTPPPPPRTSPSRDPSRPPPHYYVEPAKPVPGAPQQGPIYEPPPPLYVHEPPPPPRPSHRAPRTAFWTGARIGWFIPFGTLWHDGFAVRGSCCDYRRRTWSDYAAPGPMFEIDAGARLGRHYNIFALWEHAFLAPGGLDDDAFGGQNYGSTNLYGVGLRFSSDPDDVGILVEIAIGYRHFAARWEGDAELNLTDGMFDARIGLGADIRLSRGLSLSPLVKLGSGVFSEATWKTSRNSGSARGQLDENAQYGTLIFELGAHFDVY